MNNYPAQNIHLSSDKHSSGVAQMISLGGAIVVLLIAGALLSDFIFHLGFFEKTIVNIPTIVALVIIGVEIFLYKKNKNFQLLGLPLIAIGVVTILDYYTDLNIVSFFSAVNVKAGVVFFILGSAFVVSILKIPHRYHVMQLTTMLALSYVLFGFLESFYQILFLGKITVVNDLSIVGYFVLFIACQSTILSKADRGFIGIFTTDSRSSQLARRSLIYYAILPPLLGIIALIIGKIAVLSLYTNLALFVVLYMTTSVILTWINVKLIYPTEVDHYLMRESLRVNNISLELNADDLSSKMSALEEEKKTVTDKYNNQQTLVDLVDKVG